MKRKCSPPKKPASQSKRGRANNLEEINPASGSTSIAAATAATAASVAAMDTTEPEINGNGHEQNDDYCYNLVKVEDSVSDPPDFKYYFNRDGFGPINPLHDIPLYADKEAGILNMVVEIPRGTNAKLEIKTKEALAPIVQDRKKGKPRCKL